jgi:glycosyltransferase involved in cell wall biosynthesis
MPTANRHKFIPYACRYFLDQTYTNAELVIIDDGEIAIKELLPKDARIKYYRFDMPIGTIGKKRNFACERTDGEIIMHWDDDDYYAPDWISRQLSFLLTSNSDMCGIEHVHFYSPVTDTLWLGTSRNRNNGNFPQFLSGATLVYWKSFWAKHPFEDRNTGEDDHFITQDGAKVYAHDYIDGFVALLHPKNTTQKYFEHPSEKKNQTIKNK